MLWLGILTGVIIGCNAGVLFMALFKIHKN